MALLSRYLLRRIAVPFVMALAVVLFALSLERLLRIVQTITDQGAPVSSAFEVLIYLLPHYLGLAVPAALFLAVLIGVRRLYTGSELTALHTAGVPLRGLVPPVAGFALVLAVLTLVNVGFAQPYARYAYRATLHQVTETTLAFRLQPGVFHHLGDRVVVRADDVSRGGQLLDRFFAEVEQRDGSRTVMTARRALVRNDPETGELLVQLEDGTIVREGPGTPPGTISFDTYGWSPPVEGQAPYGPRGQGERELTLTELLAGGMPDLSAGTTADDLRSELHARLVATASLPVLALLAVPLAVLGSGRTGRAYGFVVGIALLVLYEKVLGVGEAFVAEGTVPPLLAQWGPFVFMAALAAVLMAHASEAGGRDLAVWLGLRRRQAHPEVRSA